jgi:hypothetical protein
MTTYPLDTFFLAQDAAQECQRVLDDDSEKVIIFVGSGGNGKTQLCNQISAERPGKFSVYHGGEGEKLPVLIRADIAAGRRALVCTNEVPFLQGIEADIIFIDRTFGALKPRTQATSGH